MPARSCKRIESPSNAFFVDLKKLISARGARKAGNALVSGGRIIDDLVRARPDLCEAWISTDGQPDPPASLPAHVRWYQLAPRLFAALDVTGTGAPLLRVRTPEIPPWRPQGGLAPGCTLLVPFQDPENVGAVIRSAAAFAASEVVLLAGCGNPFHARAVRASGGAVFAVPLRSGPAITDLPPDLALVPLSREGSDIESFRFPERFALLPGVEGPGLPAGLRGRALSIPISDGVESLNAATAAAIALFVWARGRSRQEST